MRFATLLLLIACAHAPDEPFPDESVCEREAALRGAECATVYAFAMPAPNELGHVELCVPERYLEDAERKHGVSWPSDSPRFTDITKGLYDPKCFWCAAPGANAYNGCWVPAEGLP